MIALKESEHITPKYTALASWLFWAKGCDKKDILISFFKKKKKADEISMWKMSSLYQKERDILITKDVKSKPR